MRTLRGSWRRAGKGGLLSVRLGGVGVPRGPRGELVRPQGLYIFLEEGSAAAELGVTLGEPDGGAEEQRKITLTRRGVWLSAAGWDHVAVDVSDVGADDVVVAAAWTTEQPPSDQRLLWIEDVIAAGTFPVPRGATSVQGASADAGWAWVTNPDGTPRTIAQPLPAAAGELAVIGDRYTATGPNTLVWQLLAP